MSETLAARHTNSLVLKKHKLLKNSESRNCCPCSKPFKLTVYCTITGVIFLIYWIILAPLVISAVSDHNSAKTTDSAVVWLVFCWFVAFLIWLLIMLCLVLIWRYFDMKCDDNVTLQSYGTNGSPKSKSSINAKLDHSQNAKLEGIIPDKDKIVYDKSDVRIAEDSRRGKIKRHRDLPPLLIHRRYFDNGIEQVGTVKVEENINENVRKNNEDEGTLKSGNDDLKRQKESTKDCLNLVSVSPQNETDTMSPKGPLSPRELFFIDLIREAEKAERNSASDPQGTKGKYFFPSDFSPTRKDVNKDRKGGKKASETPTSEEREATYFIADVESSRSEKTEVYLEIDPDQELLKEWSLNLNEEKPALVLQDNSKNEQDKNSKDKIVLFKV